MGEVKRSSRYVYEFDNNADCMRFYYGLKGGISRARGGMSLAVIESMASQMFGSNFKSTFKDSNDWKDRVKIVHADEITHRKWSDTYCTVTLNVEEADHTTIEDFQTQLMTTITNFYEQFVDSHPHLRDDLEHITIIEDIYEGRVGKPVLYKEVEE